MSARRSILAIAATVAMWATFQPGTVSAQNSGVGGDHSTVLMWRGTDYEISLWKLDANLNLLGSHTYGPFTGWIPIAITTDVNDFTYVLWRFTDGTINLWLVDPNLNFVNSHTYGPFTGWIAKGLSVDTGNSANFRVIWRHTGGSVSIWTVDGSLNFLFSHAYGPFFGWDPGYTTE